MARETNNVGTCFPRVAIDEEVEFSVSPNWDLYKRLMRDSGGKGRGGLTGLTNLGNTCYMNAAVQALANTMLLSDYFLFNAWKGDVNEDNPLGTNGEVAGEFGAVLARLWLSRHPVYTPRRLKRVIGYFAPQFAGHRQHDAQEFLSYLLDAIHEDLNEARVLGRPSGSSDRATASELRSPAAAGTLDADAATGGSTSRWQLRSLLRARPREATARSADSAWRQHLRLNRSVIVDLFHGQLRSSLTCEECGHVSAKFDPFLFLSLPLVEDEGDPVPVDSLAQALELFTRPEQLLVGEDGSGGWDCPHCKRRVDASKRLELWRLPPVLLIHLKRFRFTRHGYRIKISAPVRFPVASMDLSPYCAGPIVSSIARAEQVAQHHGAKLGPDNLQRAASAPSAAAMRRGGPVDSRGGPHHALASSSYDAISGGTLMYDLSAAINHTGGYGGGHYTCHALNRVTGGWYFMNDGVVARAQDTDLRPRLDSAEHGLEG